jgi:hypothetical protein
VLTTAGTPRPIGGRLLEAIAVVRREVSSGFLLGIRIVCLFLSHLFAGNMHGKQARDYRKSHICYGVPSIHFGATWNQGAFTYK